MRTLPPTGALEAFLAAARAGSLHGASTDLNLSVSALSRRVQKLEQHVGRTLFTRQGNDFQLNVEGRELLASIERPMQELMSAFDSRANPRVKRLSLGVPTSFATAWLIPRLADFRAEHPDIELEIDTSGAPVERLGKTLDVIIFFAAEGEREIVSHPLRRQGSYTVSLAGIVNPLDGMRSTFARTPLLVHRHLPEMLPGWLAEMKLDRAVISKIEKFDDGPLLIAAARSGLGVALVLEDMLNFHDDTDDLVRPFGEYVRTPYSYALAKKPANANSQVIDRFCDWLQERTESDLVPRAVQRKDRSAFASPVRSLGRESDGAKVRSAG